MLAACGDEQPPEPTVDATRDCASHIEGRLPPARARNDLIVGPVVFRGFRATSRFAAREGGRGFYEIRDGQYHTLKFVTEAKAGVDVIVAIAPESEKRAAMLYELDGVEYGRYGVPFEQGEQAVRFRGCPADHPAGSPRFYGRRTVGPFTQFNGGFMFTGPQCLKLDLYVEGRPARRYTEPFGYPRRSSSAASCRRSSSGSSSPKRA